MSSCNDDKIVKMFVVQPSDGGNPDLSVYENGGLILSGVTALNFLNSNVTQLGPGSVDINGNDTL